MGEAPISAFNFLTSAVGPPMRDVPVSAMAWQPPSQKAVPPTLILLKKIMAVIIV